jgi:hypothetical protein
VLDVNQLQPFQRKSLVYQALFDAESGQIDMRDTSIADLSAQMIVNTATWALAIYENDLGIITDLSQTYAERRSMILSKMRGVGVVNGSLIKLVADSFTNGNVSVSFAASTITVTFTSIMGTPQNETAFKAAIENIKPAHLAILYVYLYNRWSFIGTKTWNYISGFTWEQIHSSDAV